MGLSTSPSHTHFISVPAQPVILELKGIAEGIYIEWSEVEDATTYSLHFVETSKVEQEDNSVVYELEETSYILSGIALGRDFTVTVIAHNAAGQGLESPKRTAVAGGLVIDPSFGLNGFFTDTFGSQTRIFRRFVIEDDESLTVVMHIIEKT